MYTPHGERSGRSQASASGARSGGTTAVKHFGCGLLGLGAISIPVLLLYPVLVSLLQPLKFLSSTAIVLILAAAWVIVWLGIEMLWQRRVGDGSSSPF